MHILGHIFLQSSHSCSIFKDLLNVVFIVIGGASAQSLHALKKRNALAKRYINMKYVYLI